MGPIFEFKQIGPHLVIQPCEPWVAVNLPYVFRRTGNFFPVPNEASPGRSEINQHFGVSSFDQYYILNPENESTGYAFQLPLGQFTHRNAKDFAVRSKQGDGHSFNFALQWVLDLDHI